MGILAQSLRARLDEMKARHAESDRQTAQLLEDVRHLIAETQAALEAEEY